MVTAGRGNLERAAREQLAGDVRQVIARHGVNHRGLARARRRTRILRAERLRRFEQRANGIEVHGIDNRGLRQIGRREEQGGRCCVLGRRGNRQNAAHGRHTAIERHAAGHDRAVAKRPVRYSMRQHAPGRENPERDRQVKRGADLAHIGRRQADGDMAIGEWKPRVANGAAYPLAALPHARVRQPHHRHSRQPATDVHLDTHGNRLDARDRRRIEPSKHDLCQEQGPRQRSAEGRRIRSGRFCVLCQGRSTQILAKGGQP